MILPVTLTFCGVAALMNFWLAIRVGQARTPPVWMKAGDVIEIEVEKIGVLRNPIVAEG